MKQCVSYCFNVHLKTVSEPSHILVAAVYIFVDKIREAINIICVQEIVKVGAELYHVIINRKHSDQMEINCLFATCNGYWLFFDLFVFQPV